MTILLGRFKKSHLSSNNTIGHNSLFKTIQKAMSLFKAAFQQCTRQRNIKFNISSKSGSNSTKEKNNNNKI